MNRSGILFALFLTATQVSGSRPLAAQTVMPANEALKSPDANTRVEAVRQLVKSSDPSVLPAVASMMESGTCAVS